jgi:hypothetical protein
MISSYIYLLALAILVYGLVDKGEYLGQFRLVILDSGR